MVASKKVVLTDRFLRSLKPAPAGKRVLVWDAVQPHLGVRITDSGRCTFVVVKRRAGQARPTRHFLGRYPTLSLAEARLAAPKILTALINGDDPREQEKERLREAKLRKGETFEKVAQEFTARHVAKLKSCRSTELVIKKELLGLSLKRKRVDGRWVEEWNPTPDSRWREIPIGQIARRDVVELLEKISDGGSRYQARKVFAILSKLFNWALLRDTYGLDASPVARLRHTDILGTFLPRSRVLTDDELRLIWNAAQQVGYPFGHLVQLLMLTGQRLREISNASWSEFSPEADMLVIPPDRMKAKIVHHVPLPLKAQQLLAEIPRFDGRLGREFVFTTTGGRRPFSGFAKAKADLDRKISVSRTLPRWTLHDLRRTVRTRLSKLGIQPIVSELIIGHKQTGILAVYDLYKYENEKRNALQCWEAELLAIVESSPHPANVIQLRQALELSGNIPACATG